MKKQLCKLLNARYITMIMLPKKIQAVHRNTLRGNLKFLMFFVVIRSKMKEKIKGKLVERLGRKATDLRLLNAKIAGLQKWKGIYRHE